MANIRRRNHTSTCACLSAAVGDCSPGGRRHSRTRVPLVFSLLLLLVHYNTAISRLTSVLIFFAASPSLNTHTSCTRPRLSIFAPVNWPRDKYKVRAIDSTWAQLVLLSLCAKCLPSWLLRVCFSFIAMGVTTKVTRTHQHAHSGGPRLLLHVVQLLRGTVERRFPSARNQGLSAYSSLLVVDPFRILLRSLVILANPGISLTSHHLTHHVAALSGSLPVSQHDARGYLREWCTFYAPTHYARECNR